MEVLDGIVTFAIGLGFIVKGLTYSPIKGPEGNIEYLLYISKMGRQSDDVKKLIDDVVNLAHGNL